jgi:hypothetical protein
MSSTEPHGHARRGNDQSPSSQAFHCLGVVVGAGCSHPTVLAYDGSIVLPATQHSERVDSSACVQRTER